MKKSRYWEVQQGKVDSTEFFHALPTYFSNATTFFAEGTVISGDVAECYKEHVESGAYLPNTQTIMPRSGKYRCKFTKGLMENLALLSEIHAEPELLDHISIYKGNEPLLIWHDAFSNIILVSKTVAENYVNNFSHRLGLGYEEA